MEAVLTQIAELQNTLSAEKAKGRRNLLILAGVYIALIAWTFWDTSHVLAQIKDISAPDKVAQMAADQVKQQLPGLQHDLVAHLQKTAPQIAGRLLQSAHQTIPATGAQIKQQLSGAADQLAARMDQRVPELTEFMKVRLRDAISNARYASDEELSKALVTETVKELDQELTVALNPTLFNELLNIKKDVDQIAATPDAKLTGQQRAEKTALLNALRITELAQGGSKSSVLAQSLRVILQAGLPGDLFKALDSPVRP